MKVKILFEGISDQDGFLAFFKEEFALLQLSGIEVLAPNYRGKHRLVKRVPEKISDAFSAEGVDVVIVHIDFETDTEELMQRNLEEMRNKLTDNQRANIYWIVIQRNFESILLAGCFARERDYQSLSNSKEVVKKFFRKKFKFPYKESLHVPEYAPQLNKANVLSRIYGAREFQTLLNSFANP